MRKKLKVYVPILLSIALIIGFTLSVDISPSGQNQQLIRIKRNNFNLLSETVGLAAKNGLKSSEKEIQDSLEKINRKTIAHIARNLWHN